MNLYTYVGNNPLIRFDPSGHSWLSDRWNDTVDVFEIAGNRMWYDLTHVDQRAMEIVDDLVLDDVRTINDPNASLLNKSFAYAGFIPIGKVANVGKKLFVEILSNGNKIQAELSATVKWIPYKKHVPQKNLSWNDIIKSTANGGAARYNPGINIESIERYAWEYGKQAKSRELFKVMKFDDVIGASSGKTTNYMRVEMNSNGEIHGHPITAEQYNKYLK